MPTIQITRRQVLRGAGGTSLALPFLPSLVPRKAYGVELIANFPRNFAAFATVHGGVTNENFQPPARLLTERTEIYPGHEVRYGQLAPGGSQLSPVLKAAALTPALAKKVNVLWGFDVPFYIGHHSGGHLGNLLRSDQGPKHLRPFVTVDQFLAYSPSFYKDLSGVRARSLNTGSGGFGCDISYTYSNPSARTGVQGNGRQGVGSLFSSLFSGGTPKPTGEPPRKSIVDGLVATYKALRTSNRRLSPQDRARLDDHVARLDELERKLGATATVKCEARQPGGQGWAATNDLIAMAFSCGVSRLATVSLSGPDHNAAHSHNQGALIPWNQRDFETAFVDLAKKLDAIEIAPGKTLLDHTLVQWTNEAGPTTHDAQEMTVVTAGGAGGFFKTGLYVDFRSKNPQAHLKPFGGAQRQFLGLQYRHWLANVLLAMGSTPTEFEVDGKPGYGDAHMNGSYAPAVAAGVIRDASKPLPIITG